MELKEWAGELTGRPRRQRADWVVRKATDRSGGWIGQGRPRRRGQHEERAGGLPACQLVRAAGERGELGSEVEHRTEGVFPHSAAAAPGGPSPSFLPSPPLRSRLGSRGGGGGKGRGGESGVRGGGVPARALFALPPGAAAPGCAGLRLPALCRRVAGRRDGEPGGGESRAQPAG